MLKAGRLLCRHAPGPRASPSAPQEEHAIQRSIPWIDDRRRSQIQAMYFLSIFVDEKLEIYDTKPLYRWLARLYRPVARFRLKRGFFRGMPELALFQRLFDTS